VRLDKLDIEAAVLAPVLTGVAKEISVASSSAAATSLGKGIWQCCSTTACRILQGVSGSTTALSTSTYVPADVVFWIAVTTIAGDDGLAAIREADDGKLTLTLVVAGLG